MKMENQHYSETTLVWQQKNDIATAADVNDKIKESSNTNCVY